MTSSLVPGREMRGAVPVVTIWVCVGSSCFLRGAPDVIKAFEAEIERRAPRQVELKGTFCQELCTMGVTVRVGSKVFTAVKPDDVPRIFEEEVVPIIKGGYERGCDTPRDAPNPETNSDRPDSPGAARTDGGDGE